MFLAPSFLPSRAGGVTRISKSKRDRIQKNFLLWHRCAEPCLPCCAARRLPRPRPTFITGWPGGDQRLRCALFDGIRPLRQHRRPQHHRHFCCTPLLQQCSSMVHSFVTIGFIGSSSLTGSRICVGTLYHVRAHHTQSHRCSRHTLHKSTHLVLYGCFLMFCTLHQRLHTRRPSMCTLPPHNRERRNRTRAENPPSPPPPCASLSRIVHKRLHTASVHPPPQWSLGLSCSGIPSAVRRVGRGLQCSTRRARAHTHAPARQACMTVYTHSHPQITVHTSHRAAIIEQQSRNPI
jgi:hypothetical protein